jgi:hypothetical protein
MNLSAKEMSNVFTTCDKCGKEILYGNSYVTIARNVEQAEHIISSNKDEVQVIDSELLLTLCGRCGNAFHYDIIARIIDTIPIKGSPDKSN